MPLHEWKETFEFNYSTGLYDLGTEHSPTTWIFEAGSFVPCGKITNGKHYSIITDHLGTPIEAYNQEGALIWEREQDLYGNSRQGFAKENFRCPFKYQEQYYDPEIELCYNRSDRIAKKSHKCNKKTNFKWKIEYLLNNYVIKDGMSKQ